MAVFQSSTRFSPLHGRKEAVHSGISAPVAHTVLRCKRQSPFSDKRRLATAHPTNLDKPVAANTHGVSTIWDTAAAWCPPSEFWASSIAVAFLVAPMLFPAPGIAAESLTSSGLEIFQQFLVQIEALGPWGAVLFVLTVALSEMVPFFPTQPLSLASGLLFGAQKGTIVMLLGVTLAALSAFTISRGVGRSLAQRVIAAELGHSNTGAPGNPVAATMASVDAAIKAGGFWRQASAVALLRLTPVVPFSASNYLLGLTPVMPTSFLAGTVTGMSVWSALYATLGGTSRALLENGADVGVLVADLLEKASEYTSNIAIGGVAVVSVGVVGWLLWRRSAVPVMASGHVDLEGRHQENMPPGRPTSELPAEESVKTKVTELASRRRD